MATVYGAHLSPEERELEMIMLESDAEWARIQAMEYIYEASTSAAYLEAERSVLANSGTVEDLEDAYLMVEAENEGKGKGLLASIGDWIVRQVSKFGEWISKVFSPKIPETGTVKVDKQTVGLAQAMINAWNSAKNTITSAIDRAISAGENVDIQGILTKAFKDVLGAGLLGAGIFAISGHAARKSEGVEDTDVSIIKDIEKGATSMLDDLKNIGTKISDAYNSHLEENVTKSEEKKAAKEAQKNGGSEGQVETASARLDNIEGELYEEKTRGSIYLDPKQQGWDIANVNGPYASMIREISNMDAGKKEYMKPADIQKFRDRMNKATVPDGVDLSPSKAALEKLINQLGKDQQRENIEKTAEDRTVEKSKEKDPNGNSNLEAASIKYRREREANASDANQSQSTTSTTTNTNGSQTQQPQAQQNQPTQSTSNADALYSEFETLTNSIKRKRKFTDADATKLDSQYNAIKNKFTTAHLTFDENNAKAKACADAIAAYKGKIQNASGTTSTNTAANTDNGGAENPPAEADKQKTPLGPKVMAALQVAADGVRQVAGGIINFFSEILQQIGGGVEAVAAAGQAAADTVKGVPKTESTELYSLFGVSDDDLMDINESYNEDLETLDDLFAML